MPHARYEIRQQAYQTLSGITELVSEGGIAYNSMLYPKDTSPSISVYTRDEEIYSEQAMGTKQLRVLQLEVQAVVKHKEGYAVLERPLRLAAVGVDYYLDTLCAGIEAALYVDQTLGGRCKYLEYQGTSIELSDETDQPIAQATMVFNVLYRVDASDPTTVID